MKLGTLLRHFNQQDEQQVGFISLEQVDKILNNIYECNKECKQFPITLDQIYFDNLLLKGAKEFTIEDIIMIITEIDYYEELRQLVMQQQQEQNLNQIQSEMLIAQIEGSQRDKRRVDYLNNPYINNLITMLKDYYKICCKNGDVKEMHRIENRIQEIKVKQQKRWKNYITQLQKYQETLVQKTAFEHQYHQQKKWNEFVIDFQNSRFYKFNMLLVRIYICFKEQQKKTIQEMSKQFQEELQPKVFKVSKKVLDMRSKQKQLLKLKEFSQAEKVKEEADMLEYLEKKQQEMILKSKVKRKLKVLKKRQSCQISAFMQKVASEQATHLLQKQANENRWVNINKHCVQDINERFNKDRIITLASRRSFDACRLRTKSANPQAARTNISHQLTSQFE
ncbi:unnamed protein product (macronuclear) [Paramecium tetraurelia]|uniref:EF-hand domain-containing protein n=1 Tax=Paramecium tetraurelia TaxID=5888 RepID=A0CK80_PARTE|nr:uncharacterized protein GSPATT00000910001 [Paramecium tetraurelia]CAK71197.1 unnamed protein product [Paramecium tetraurelia]|eukprot:XP_001438594.1 hypothetical protein (macronuclear) [Paramecium tetraurelia strain d4-2]